MINLIQGDALSVLKTLTDESINCVITSPPYWSLRDYQIAGQLGLEDTFQEYITKLCDIFDEAKRVLRKDGTCWVNLGDTYNSHQGDPYKVGGFQGKQHHKNKQYGDSVAVKRGTNVMPDKCLLQIPSRFSIEMCNRGWILRNEIIWHKPNCMPSSVDDRFTVDFEKVFFFVKSRKYWFEQQFDNYQDSTIERAKHNVFSEKTDKGIHGGMTLESQRKAFDKILTTGQGRNKRCVWTISTQPFSESHFATFPEKLVEPMVLSGCPEFVCKECGKAREKIIESEFVGSTEKRGGRNIGGNVYNLQEPFAKKQFKGYTDCGCNAEFAGGIVLDPFSGAGTTGLVAKKLGRSFIGIELNEQYIEMSRRRIAKIPESLF